MFLYTGTLTKMVTLYSPYTEYIWKGTFQRNEKKKGPT